MDFFKDFIKVFLPLFLISSVLAYLAYQYHKDELREDVIQERQTSLSLKKDYFKDFLNSAIADIYYLGNSDIPLRILENNQDQSGAVDDLTLFAQTARRYDQLRIIDTIGRELFRINYINEKAVLVPPDSLQDKSHRYYFQDLKRLESGQLYVSPSDLNIEFKQVEVPYKPVIRLIMRIENHQLKGYLVANILLSEFFKDLIAIASQPGMQFMLLNQEGYYLIAPEGFDTYGFMFENKPAQTFKQRFSETWHLLTEKAKGAKRTDEGLIIFNNINFRSFFTEIPYLSPNLILTSESNNFRMVSLVPDQIYKGLINRDLSYLLLAFFVNALVSALIAFTTIKIKQKDILVKSRILEEKQKLQQLVLQLESRNAKLRDFSQIVSHNLRSPVANLNMLIEMLSQAPSDEKKNLEAKLTEVIVAVNDLLDDLLETVNIINTQELKMDDCNLADTLGKIKNLLSVDIEKTKATIIDEFDEWQDIEYPKMYFESIIQNLLTNAIKYRQLDQPPVIRFRSYYQDGHKILAVTDNGIGIDLQRHQDAIFKLHKRFHRNRSGRGLGLFMIKTQVDSLNGKVFVKSEPDKGSTFYIQFNQ